MNGEGWDLHWWHVVGRIGEYDPPSPEAYAVLAPKPDAINPPHYKELSPEPIDVIEGWSLNYHRGQVIKYVSRAGRKEDEIADLRKARWYLDREIERLEGKAK